MALRDQTLHRYAIIKAIEGTYGYPPSPGIVYPTLQMLEDQGFLQKSSYKPTRFTVSQTTGDAASMNTVTRSTASILERICPGGIQFQGIPGISTKLTEIARAILAN